MRQLSAGDAWQYTLNLLDGGSVLCPGAGNGSHRPASGPFSKQSMPALRAHLAFVETWSENLISVSWSDPTNGRYVEQPWRLCIARRRGMCALTGADILRGDRIYRPFSRGTPPVNADWTVLASALKK